MTDFKKGFRRLAEKISRNKKKSTVIIAAAVAIAGSAAIFALTETKTVKVKENYVNPATINIAVRENGNSSNSNAALTNSKIYWSAVDDDYVTKKEVKIANIASSSANKAPAYIRVCLLPRWAKTDSTSTKIDVAVAGDYTQFGDLTAVDWSEDKTSYTMGDVTFTLADDWADNWIFNPNDGYFYYKKIVEPGESTELLLKTVSISKDVLQDGVNLQVDVLSDAIQTVGGALDGEYGRWQESGVIIGDDGELKLESDTNETNESSEAQTDTAIGGNIGGGTPGVGITK